MFQWSSVIIKFSCKRVTGIDFLEDLKNSMKKHFYKVKASKTYNWGRKFERISKILSRNISISSRLAILWS